MKHQTKHHLFLRRSPPHTARNGHDPESPYTHTSDEPETDTQAIATTEKDESKIGAFVTKPYAEHLRTAFPHATFVGFTGTPIDETIQVFGDIVDRYTMQQAVDDESTKKLLKYIPRIAQVTLIAPRSKR